MSCDQLLVATHDVDEAVTLANRIVVMRPHPGRIAAVVALALPRPRRRKTPEFDAAAARILDLLEDLPTADETSIHKVY